MKPLAVAAALLLVGASGCARDDGVAELPTVCSAADPTVFVAALAAAPDPVRVDGTRISDCLPKDATAGDVQLVGSLLVDVAGRLGEERRVLELGYLVGAVRRGAEGSQGIHLEIVRRVEQEAARFEESQPFARGERAGRTSG